MLWAIVVSFIILIISFLWNYSYIVNMVLNVVQYQQDAKKLISEEQRGRSISHIKLANTTWTWIYSMKLKEFFVKCTMDRSLSYYDAVVPLGVAVVLGEDHGFKLQRYHTVKAFANSHKYTQLIAVATSEYVQKMELDKIRVFELSYPLVSLISTMALCGTNIGNLDSLFLVFNKEAEQVLRLAAVFPRWFPRRILFRKLNKCRTLISAILHTLIKQARDHPNEVTTNFISFLSEKNELTVEEITTWVIGVMWASLTTTANRLGHLLLDIVTNTNVMIKLQDEIDRVVSKTDSIDVELCNKEKMPVLDACIQESLRLTVGLAGAMRKATQSIDVDNDMIKKDDLVVFTGYSFHYSDMFGDRPDNFDPDRFLVDSKEDIRKRRKHLLSFGLGHICPGQKFALFELKVMLIVLFKRFHITVEGKRPPRNHQGMFEVVSENIELILQNKMTK